MPTTPLYKAITLWNHRLHIYLGMYALAFTWLFAFSGLVLNHPSWQFAQFWDSRRETSSEVAVRMPSAPSDLACAGDLMEQLRLSGEIEKITRKPASFEFRVARPQQITTVTVSQSTQLAKVQQISWNGWGTLSALHRLTGVHGDDAALTRNRAATRLWSLWIDAGSIALLLLVAGGIYVWYQRREARLAGLIVLLAGTLCCGVFALAL